MITIYNSNLDFDLDSSNSITLSSTSNMVFKTNGTDKMTIQNNGINVSGNVVVSGLITSTGAGFSGIGAGLSNIPISAINELRLELNGGTTELSVTRDTLNASIVSEARFGSNYTGRINSELNTRVDNTSNYVLATSNILIGRIINTSNYVDSTSNFLSGRIDNTSNYVLATSNILIGRVINTSNYVESTSNTLIGRIINTSNYVESTSNTLIGRVINASNYVESTSNTLIGRIINASNYVLATSNILADYNNLINKPFQINGANIFYNSGNVGIGTNAPLSLMEIITANYTGALLTLDAGIVNSTTQMPRNIGRPLLKLGKTSVSTSAGDYYGIGFGISPTLSDYNCAEIGTIITSTTGLETGDIIFSTRPVTNNVIATERMRITSAGNVGIGTTDTTTYKLNVGGTLNTTGLYVNGAALTTTLGLKQDVLTSANTIGVFNTTTDFVVNGAKIELTNNTSNYILATSNLLSRRIDSTSNYSDRVGGWGSNYTDKADIWGSNYSDRVGVWGSNYAYDKVGVWSSNYSDRVGVWGSNYAYDKVGVWSSNYTDRVGIWSSNYAYDKVGAWGSNYTDRIGERSSNYVLATSNILIGRIINTSNYVSSYKPATAVRADTATTLFTSRKIANVPFDGSADINIPYNNLNNILVASTGINIDANNYISATYASADLVGIFNTTDFADVNSKIELTKNTSNYVTATSNILIGRVRNTSNYIDSINTSLTAAIVGKANSSHTHVISDITSLQTTLDGKASSSHTHDSLYIPGEGGMFKVFINNIQRFGVNAGGVDVSTNFFVNGTNIITALDGKANSSHTHDSLYIPGGANGLFKVFINNTERFGVNGGGVNVNTDLYVSYNINASFTAVAMTGTDYLCVQQNYTSGQTASNWIRIAFGSFTAFHRCYTDDELYNNETDESIDLFKNNFVGRVVIATGKIKTDLTRSEETIEREGGISKSPNSEWYTLIDKDAITIEDAIPIVKLSRKKKDKRVFGVLGSPTRNTNNKERLIVNSVGEGGICVANTNGNIENGDYLQTSDLLGYSEKQDDDLLHNYTIGKATIDCNFELDSPYYQCREIENGVRVAFIACSYHCG